MIRPRGGDFCYGGEELEVMREDIKIFKEEKVDGLVFGILKQDGTVDKEKCSELLTLSQPLPVTFHRAFDMSRDLFESLEAVVALGFSQVLTSGGKSTAEVGVVQIRELVEHSARRIVIMPGGGVNVDNIGPILRGSGAVEFHGSASVWRDSGMRYRNESIGMGTSPDYRIRVTDSDIVASLVEAANKIWNTSQ